MIVEEKVIITLTEKDVKQIIASYLGSQGHEVLAENIEFKIQKVIDCDDDMACGPLIETLAFNGCTVTYSPPANRKASTLTY